MQKHLGVALSACADVAARDGNSGGRGNSGAGGGGSGCGDGSDANSAAAIAQEFLQLTRTKMQQFMMAWVQEKVRTRTVDTNF